MNNVLAGNYCHDMLITCYLACGVVSPSWGGGSVIPDGQSHHSLSDTGHITSMAGERELRGRKHSKTHRRKLLSFHSSWSLTDK